MVNYTGSTLALKVPLQDPTRTILLGSNLCWQQCGAILSCQKKLLWTISSIMCHFYWPQRSRPLGNATPSVPLLKRCLPRSAVISKVWYLAGAWAAHWGAEFVSGLSLKETALIYMLKPSSNFETALMEVRTHKLYSASIRLLKEIRLESTCSSGLKI